MKISIRLVENQNRTEGSLLLCTIMMQLFELIHCLKEIEKAFWWYVEVYVKYGDFSEFRLSAIIPEKKPDGEVVIILE